MISKVEHIGIMVSDLDRSIAFYRDVLGLEFVERLKNNATEIAFFKVGDVQIELVKGSSAPYEKTDGIVNHLTFTVMDLDAALQMLKDKGVELINSEPVAIWGGMRVLFFSGPDGERLEFFERITSDA